MVTFIPGKHKALILVMLNQQDDNAKQLLPVGVGTGDLEKALRDQDAGCFEVSVLESGSLIEVKAAVEAFFNDCDPEDVLLLYIACRGVKSLDGKMYFAVSETDIQHLMSTAVSAEFINDAAKSSFSIKKFLFMDCSLLLSSNKGRIAQTKIAKSAVAACSIDQFTAPGMGVAMAFNSVPFILGRESCRQSLAKCLADGLDRIPSEINAEGIWTFQDLCDHLNSAGLAVSTRQPEEWDSSDLLTEIPHAKRLQHPEQAPSTTISKEAGETRRCPICYVECNINARFCSRCGNLLPVTRKVRDSIQGGKVVKEREAPSFSRYPLIEAPEKVVYRKPFTLSVYLKIEPSQLNEEPMRIFDSPLLINDPEAIHPPPEVEVLIEAYGFDVLGSYTKVLPVDRRKDSKTEFTLLPLVAGERLIQVEFFQKGHRRGIARRTIIVSEKVENTKDSASLSPAALELEEFPAPPVFDLEIYVSLKRTEEYILSYRLLSLKESIGYHHAKFGEVTLRGSPQEKMLWVYEQMGNMASQSSKDVDRNMRNLGMELWDELIPRELKEAYWQFRDKVRTLLITSDEPWIPWEMLKPHRYKEDQGREEIDPFLCQQFIMSRWLCGESCGAKDLSKGAALPVAPQFEDLPSVKAEVDFIENLSSLDPDIRPEGPFQDKSELLDLLEGGSFTILHFATHCGFDSNQPNDSAILLSNGSLRPSDIHTTFDGKRRPRPLVFINACKGGRIDFSFTGLGGWADRFINKANVGALIGAMWEVKDDLALEFARSFYTSLLFEKKTVAQSMRQAREEVKKRDPFNSTWLAYVLYADPEVRMIPTDRLVPGRQTE